jgi:hypothetical protein
MPGMLDFMNTFGICDSTMKEPKGSSSKPRLKKKITLKKAP